MSTTHQLSPPRYITKHSAYALISLLILIFGLLPTSLALLWQPGMAGILTAVHLCVTIAVAFVLGLKNTRAALLVLLLVLPWQPLLSMPFAEQLGGAGIKMLVATKDVYTGALLLALYLRYGRSVKWVAADLAAVLFVLVYALFAVISPANLLGIAVSFREGFMVAAFYFVGRLSLFKRNDINWFLRSVLFVGLLVALFGYVEYFLWSEEWWTSWGAGTYFEAKNGRLATRFNVPGQVPFNWHTGIGGTMYRRMVSGIGDPTSLARYLSFPLLTLFFLPRSFVRLRKYPLARFFLLGLFVLALVLTLGRGGWLIALFGFIVWLMARKFTLALVSAPLVLLLFLSPFISTAAAVHAPSANRGLQALIQTPWGRGLGTAGQLALYYADDALEGTGESYLAALSFQSGFLGVITYTLFIFLLAYKFWTIYRMTRRRRDDLSRMSLLALALILAIFLTSLFANSAVAPISAGISLLYCGMFLTACQFPLNS